MTDENNISNFIQKEQVLNLLHFPSESIGYKLIFRTLQKYL